MRLILKGGTVLDGSGRRPLREATVVISHGRIEAVLRRHQAIPPAQAGDEVVDCAGLFLLPGLVDSHVHLAFAAGPDHESTKAVLAHDSEEMLLLRQVHHAQQCLASGITTVRDCGGRGLSTLALRDAIAEGLILGPRIVAAGTPITTTAGHLHFCGYRADNVDEVRKATRTLIERGADFIKVMATGGMMTPGSNPNLPQYSQEELNVIATEAHRLGRRVAAHVGAAEGMRRCVRAGIDTLEHGDWRNPDGSSGYDPRVAEQMAQQGTVIGLAVPGIQRAHLLDTHGTPASRQAEIETLYAKYAVARAMRAAGVTIIVSSDAGVRLTPFGDIYLSLKLFSMMMDLSPLDTLVAATNLPAQALRLGDELGTLAPGKRADILVLDRDPLEDLDHLRLVHAVIRDGVPLVSEGRLALSAPPTAGG